MQLQNRKTELTVTCICLLVPPSCVGRLSTWYRKRHKEAKKHLSLRTRDSVCIIVGTNLLLGVCAVFIGYCWHPFRICDSGGRNQSLGSCRNSSGVQRPADSCGTSSVPLRISPKVLLPTKLWMNSELKQLWWDSWQLTERHNQIIAPWFAVQKCCN